MRVMRPYIEAFILNRKLTLAKLTACLGYKSRTSVDRIMDGSANHESVRKFEKRMLKAFALSPEEARALREAVQITVEGRDAYAARLEMQAFLRGGAAEDEAERDADIEDVDDGRVQFLAERYGDATDIRVTVLNCQYVPIFSQLRALLRKRDATVTHYLCVNANAARTTRAINALMPIFYEKRYFGYVLTDDALPAGVFAQGVSCADMLVCAYRDASGTPREDLIVFDQSTHGLLLSRANADGDFLRVLGIAPERYTPFKRTYFECGAFDNYIQYSLDYTNLELNRAIYKIKPDIGIDYVHPDILAAAVREGPMPRDEQFDAVLEALEAIYVRRNRDAFTKRKPTHTILKRRAMFRFAQTGKTSDHFWGMRAFTPAERARILEELLRQQTENPYFHLYFLKDDDALLDGEIACYDDVGIMMLDANTNYNLSDSHSEVMVTHAAFMRLFKDFFMQHLIKQQALPERETLRILGELIDSTRML